MNIQKHILATFKDTVTGQWGSSIITVQAASPDLAIELIESIPACLRAAQPLDTVCVRHEYIHHRDLPSRAPEVELIATEELVQELARRSHAIILGLQLAVAGDAIIRQAGSLVTCLGMGYETVRQVQDSIDRARAQNPNSTNQQEDSHE